MASHFPRMPFAPDPMAFQMLSAGLASSITGMAAQNAGIAFRVSMAPGDARDIAYFYVDWGAITGGTASVTGSVQTIDPTTGKPTGTLYDAAATLTQNATSAAWQKFQFAAAPTANATNGGPLAREYAICLLNNTAGITALAPQYMSGASGYPIAALTSADARTAAGWAEAASPVVPLLTVGLTDGTTTTEETLGCSAFNASDLGTLTQIYLKKASGVQFLVPSGATLTVRGWLIDYFVKVGTPPGDLLAAIYDNSGAVVAGTSVTTSAPSIASSSTRKVRQRFLPVQLAAGTYNLLFSQAGNVGSSANYWQIRNAVARAAVLVAPSYYAVSSTDITALTGAGLPAPATDRVPAVSLLLDDFGGTGGGSPRGRGMRRAG